MLGGIIYVKLSGCTVKLDVYETRGIVSSSYYYFSIIIINLVRNFKQIGFLPKLQIINFNLINKPFLKIIVYLNKFLKQTQSHLWGYEPKYRESFYLPGLFELLS